MKRVYAYTEVATANQNLIDLVKADNKEFVGYVEQLCIYNVSDINIDLEINKGNTFELEPGEGFEVDLHVYSVVVKTSGATVKFSCVA